MKPVDGRAGISSALFLVLTTLVAVAVVAPGVAAPAGGAASPRPQRLQDWTDGPVRYLLSKADVDDFRRMESDPARALFIVRFWRRWDPTPSTLENESRREYWWRVFEANRRYRDSIRPGWMTDRGRVFILLGEPDTEEKDERGGMESLPGRGSRSEPNSASPGGGRFDAAPSTVENDTSERGLLRWIYRNLPGKTLEPETVFAFTRDTSGEWRLSRNPRTYGPSFPGMSVGDLMTTEGSSLAAGAAGQKGTPPPSQLDIAVVPGQASITTQLFGAMEMLQQMLALSDIGKATLLALDRAEALNVPAPGQVMADIVTSNEFLNRLPVEARYVFFRATDGRTIVRIGAAIRPRALYTDETITPDLTSFLLLYARLAPQAARAPGAPEATAPVPDTGAPAERPVVYVNNESAPVRVGHEAATGEAALEAWTQAVVPAGTYEVGLGFEDAATGQVTSRREPLQVPAFSGTTLALSSLLPVHGIDQGESGLQPRPKVEAVFPRTGDFGIYFEVYGLVPGQPFTLTSRFFLLAGEEIRPIGQPVVRDGMTDPAQGWTFPLAKWPAGRFRLEMTATQGASSASGTLDFTVK